MKESFVARQTLQEGHPALRARKSQVPRSEKQAKTYCPDDGLAIRPAFKYAWDRRVQQLRRGPELNSVNVKLR